MTNSYASLPFLSQVKAEARKRGLSLPAARPTAASRPALADWLARIAPAYNWQWPYLRHVIAQLERVTRGECKRLMLFLPPRHGKSELATVRYPVYRLAYAPTQRVIIGAYNQTLANTFSRKARKVAEQIGLPLSQERHAAEQWETTAGGGLLAVGVGAGVTGHGADLIVIDDPVKSREEAESEAYRARVWDWYTNDLYTRLQPGGAIVLIMTRWHGDDLAGRILRSQSAPDWTVVSLPAEAESGDALGRAEGEALNPDRFPLSELAGIKSVLGRSYYALYQQSPRPREGGMFKEHWLPLVDAVPAVAHRVRWWDKAATEADGDYTAGVLVAQADGIFYVEDVVRGQWASGERDKIIRLTAEKDKAQHGDVRYWSEQEPGSGGKDQAAAFVRLLVGYSARTEPSTGSKEVRADPLAAQAQAGNVKVKRAAWTSAFIAEMLDFPSGVHDDQVDAVAGAFNKCVTGSAASRMDNPFY